MVVTSFLSYFVIIVLLVVLASGLPSEGGSEAGTGLSIAQPVLAGTPCEPYPHTHQETDR